MGLSDWLKKQATAVAIALSSVEKNALGQQGKNLEDVDGQHQRLKQGTLSDDLTRGELTQQVKELRWRTYKVLQETENWITNSEPVYYEGEEPKNLVDDEGNVTGYTEGRISHYINTSTKHEDKHAGDLAKLKVDPFDKYKPEICLINDEITQSVKEAMEGGAKVSAEDKNSLSEYLRPLLVEREYRPRIELERFTHKMIVRKVSEEERLLEFYISKYPDEYDKRTSLVTSECKKIINGRRSDMTDIQKVGFISMDDVGVPDYLQFEYEVDGFNRIVEYDGNYVLKFRAKVVVNGEYILQEFLEEELEERYKNKEAK
jgi:hypothetical protein